MIYSSSMFKMFVEYFLMTNRNFVYTSLFLIIVLYFTVEILQNILRYEIWEYNSYSSYSHR